ncbi:migration and invasion enhancer 1 [Falco biarmicus]|nr:migration and invasion enhancer 1 [Falco cherrug]XP_055646079.1 migration and invasion enhancer 1 [Falco peregrinus]XP_056218711.1 migration and invasion enhancer 1 [Falco biarmicus]
MAAAQPRHLLGSGQTSSGGRSQLHLTTLASQPGRPRRQARGEGAGTHTRRGNCREPARRHGPPRSSATRHPCQATGAIVQEVPQPSEAVRSSRPQVAPPPARGSEGSGARPEAPRHVAAPGSGGRAAGPAAMSGGAEAAAAAGEGAGAGAERRVRIVVEYCEPCGFEPTYQELASAVKEEYPDIEIESRLGGTGAFEIEINGQLVFSKLENGGFPYEKDLIEAIRRARNGEPLEKITNSRPPCVIL